MFIGRPGPLAAARAAARPGTDGPRGLVVAGEAGAGKSRLLAEVIDGMTGIDRIGRCTGGGGGDGTGGGPTVVQAVGTQATSTIPLGAFAHALADEPPLGNLLAWATNQLLTASRGRGELLLVVDDAHWLDLASASLVHHLVVHGRARVLVTVRTGEPAPDPILALWKDELVERIELEPLSSAEVAEVLTGVLGGPTDSCTVSYLARASRGNLLYLRELVHAGRTTGALAPVDRLGRDGGDGRVGRDGGEDSVWCWRGGLSLTSRLADLIGARIGRLEPDVAEVLELVAFGEPLDHSLLDTLTSAACIEVAEDRGLISIAADGRVWLGHPLYGEAIRHECGTMRTRRRLRELADAVEAAGTPHGEDVLRVAVWRMDSQTADDPRLLLSGAKLAWARQDLALAARLSRAAVATGGGLEAAAVLGQVLTVLGRPDEAAAVLQHDTGDLADDRERAQHAISLALNLASAGSDGEACRSLDSALAAVTDQEWRQELLIYRSLVDFLAGRITTAGQLLARAPALGPMTTAGGADFAALAAWISAYSGMTSQSIATAERALADAPQWQVDAPQALPTLLDAECAAYLFSGDLDNAEKATTASLSQVDLLSEWDLAVAAFGAHRAMVSRLRGQAGEALRRCREDSARLRSLTPYTQRHLGELAHAAALCGEVDAAKSALAEADSMTASWPFTRQPALLARAWVAAADGDVDTAVREAIAAAGHAEKHELAGYLMFALHDVVRLGAAPQVADQLTALAGDSTRSNASTGPPDTALAGDPEDTHGHRSATTIRLDGPLVALCAQHAAAAVADDGRDLIAVSDGFERLGMLLYAAEASAQAAGAFRRAGRSPSARAAEARAWALSQQCPGVQTPALVELAAPQLTPRQREIAQLAAAGLSNRQIADRLTVSLRTAANHLQAVYDKLGVNDRTDLGGLLASPHAR